MTAKQAHPGFNQLICASPAVKVRLKGGLNRSAAPPPSLGISGLPRNTEGGHSFSSRLLHGWCLLVRSSQSSPRQCEAYLSY